MIFAPIAILLALMAPAQIHYRMMYYSDSYQIRDDPVNGIRLLLVSLGNGRTKSFSLEGSFRVDVLCNADNQTYPCYLIILQPGEPPTTVLLGIPPDALRLRDSFSFPGINGPTDYRVSTILYPGNCQLQEFDPR